MTPPEGQERGAGAPLRLAVGIGNPGREYEGTRHNVGFEVVRGIAAQTGTLLEAEKAAGLGRSYGRLGRIRNVAGEVCALLLEPWTYVNETGRAVRSTVDRFGLRPSDVLVVVDDFHLAVGAMRVRAQGSSGGHNGLKSIEAHLGTQAYPRFRIGIGSPGSNSVGHVLSRFSKRDREELDVVLAHVVDAVLGWLRTGDLQAMMNRYNGTIEDLGSGPP